jgi:uncharacterized protein YydD (DUF2326 family)
MIHQIFSSTLDSFKTQILHAACNLIVAEKTAGASDQQTRNSAGKSSILEIIHFVLGGDVDRQSIFRTDALKPHSFGLTFDLNDQKVIAERSGETANRIVIREGSPVGWPHSPELDGSIRYLKKNDWKEILGALVFGLPTDAPLRSPTFRMIFPYFARWRRRTSQGSDDGFLDPRKYSVSMQLWQQQVALAWLFGLEWRIESEFEDLRLKEKALKTLKKEFKAGVFQSVIGTAPQLRSRQAVLEKRVARLETELLSFQVLPEYHELEREASDIANRLATFANQNTQDEENLLSLQSAVAEELPPAANELLRVYEEADIVLAQGVMRRLDDVKQFHEAVIRNRILHLQSEIKAIEARLIQRRDEMTRIDSRRREVMQVLSTHGALDQYMKLQGELTKLKAEAAEVRGHRELADRIESSQTDLALERATLQKRLQIDIRERESTIQSAVVLFEEYSKRLSEYEGTLTVSPSDNGLDVEVQVPGYRGKALSQMQVFCFDLMLSVLIRRRGLGPGFLIHDSHLFDGMDPRQVGLALELAAETAIAEGFQYIATLNSDTLEHPDLLEHFDPTDYVVPGEKISDATEVGGLFGFRFD